MVHVYHGDGKGKTTAATGLAVRASQAGYRVIFAQFLKDDSSSEIKQLKSIQGIKVMHPDHFFGFVSKMTDEEKKILKQSNDKVLEEIIKETELAGNEKILVVLDEILHAINYNLVDGKLVERLVEMSSGSEEAELCMTGRNPGEELLNKADYVTLMQKQKHPYDKGIYARVGIEL